MVKEGDMTTQGVAVVLGTHGRDMVHTNQIQADARCTDVYLILA